MPRWPTRSENLEGASTNQPRRCRRACTEKWRRSNPGVLQASVAAIAVDRPRARDRNVHRSWHSNRGLAERLDVFRSHHRGRCPSSDDETGAGDRAGVGKICGRGGDPALIDERTPTRDVYARFCEGRSGAPAMKGRGPPHSRRGRRLRKEAPTPLDVSNRRRLSTNKRLRPTPAPKTSTSRARRSTAQRRCDLCLEHRSGTSDGTTTLPYRCARESRIVRDIASWHRRHPMHGAVAVFSRIGHDTINATATTPLS